MLRAFGCYDISLFCLFGCDSDNRDVEVHCDVAMFVAAHLEFVPSTHPGQTAHIMKWQLPMASWSLMAAKELVGPCQALMMDLSLVLCAAHRGCGQAWPLMRGLAMGAAPTAPEGCVCLLCACGCCSNSIATDKHWW